MSVNCTGACKRNPLKCDRETEVFIDPLFRFPFLKTEFSLTETFTLICFDFQKRNEITRSCFGAVERRSKVVQSLEYVHEGLACI